jgi:uncharacterized protein (TIGR02391 family)
MQELVQKFPDPESLLALEPHELGLRLLSILKERQKVSFSAISKYNIVSEVGEDGDRSRGTVGFPQEFRSDIQLAVSEALSWLESSGLLVLQRNNSGGGLTFSRRAKEVETLDDYKLLQQAAMLPRSLLHPRLRDKIWAAFLRREYAVAVLLSMKEVEVSVREAGEFKQTDIGVNLMRAAFHKETGPLTDNEQNDGEKEALISLFVGAIGSYKNPHSHRNVPLDDPSEAVEIVLLANHLLRIVDARSTAKQE